MRWNLSRERYLEPLPKNRRPRTVDLTTELCDRLRREKLARSKQLGVLHLDKVVPALTREGEKAFVARVGEGHFRRHFADAKKAAGITDERVTPHALRHTFASGLLSLGHPIALVADAIGDTVSVTQTRYAKFIRRARHDAPPADDLVRWMATGGK